jgi:hypothetical protein
MTLLAFAAGWPAAVTAAMAANAAPQTSSPAKPAAAGTTLPAATPKAPTKPPEILDLETRLDIRDPFNLGRGKVRIVAFLSPTCIHCIHNVGELQTQILDKMPGADIVVHAVWLPMLGTDNRAAIAHAATVLHDARVRHYWDPERVLNAQLLDAIQFDVMVRMYDVFLLYDRDTVWDKRVPRPGYWMHQYSGAPGPAWDVGKFAEQVDKALANQPLDTPQP